MALDNARLFEAAQREIAERKQMEGVLRERELQYHQLVTSLPAALYTCDAQGRIMLYNEAAVALWGREPKVGKDLWCGSWRIYEPDGTPLPLDQCPMAVAIREGRSIRGKEIVIERPDGTQRYVLPYPEPIRNASGEVIGAVNMLVDITERKRAEAALQQAHATLEQRVQERTALVALMQDITRAANEAPRSAEALQYAVDRLCAYTGWPVGHVYLAVAPGADRWAPTALWHLDAPERFTAFQQATQTVEVVAGESLIGRVGACGQPEWCGEVATDPTFHRRHAALAAGLTAGIAVPILVGHEVAGVLEFYAAEPLAPEPSPAGRHDADWHAARPRHRTRAGRRAGATPAGGAAPAREAGGHEHDAGERGP